MAMQTQNLGANALWGGVGDIFNVMTAFGEYKNSQEQGDSAAVSIAKGMGNFAWGEFYYGGVARFVNESAIGKGFGAVGRGLGSVAGGAVGGATGGAIGGLTRAVGGASAKGAIGKAAGVGLQAGATVGKFAGGMIGGMIPVMALTLAPQMAAQVTQFWSNTGNVMGKAYRQRGKLGSGYFEMTQAGYTMRQRSLNAIRQNGLNMQSALGNEARTYYRNSGLDN